jgi:hypothetical protein
VAAAADVDERVGVAVHYQCRDRDEAQDVVPTRRGTDRVELSGGAVNTWNPAATNCSHHSVRKLVHWLPSPLTMSSVGSVGSPMVS